MLGFEELRSHCLGLPGTTEDFPFDEETLVFKVKGKLFALTSISKVPRSVNLKCKPDVALELRDKYEGVLPGYHMNKKHWNTVLLDDEEIAKEEILAWVNDSYQLVVKGLKKADREALEALR